MRLPSSLSFVAILLSAGCGGRTSLDSLAVSGGRAVSLGGTTATGATVSTGGVGAMGGNSSGRASTGGMIGQGGAGGGLATCTWGFASPVAYSVGAIPGDVVAGDFDGDGALDLAVATLNDVRVLINRGDGTFRSYVVYNGGDWPVSVTPGDFNADGYLDLVTVTNVNGTSAVSMLFNQGDGSFAPPITFPAGKTPDDALVGDLDGDASLDLVVANSGSFSVFINHGDGTFFPQVINEMAGLSSIVLADFDRDGSLDLAATDNGAGAVELFFNQGNGTFRPSATYDAGQGASSVAAADYDGDGTSDLAIAHADTWIANHGGVSVTVLLNQGDGTFRPGVSYGVGSYGGTLRSGDFNSDGSPDLVVPNQHDDTMSVLLNQGDGTFQPQIVYATGHLPATIAVGDFNRDGALDVAVTNWLDNSIGVFFGQCR